MPYTVVTPYFNRKVDTLAEARRVCHSGLDSIAAKRGYSMTVEKDDTGSRVVERFDVFNSKGRRVTGAHIVRGGTRPVRKGA